MVTDLFEGVLSGVILWVVAPIIAGKAYRSPIYLLMMVLGSTIGELLMSPGRQSLVSNVVAPIVAGIFLGLLYRHIDKKRS